MQSYYYLILYPTKMCIHYAYSSETCTQNFNMLIQKSAALKWASSMFVTFYTRDTLLAGSVTGVKPKTHPEQQQRRCSRNEFTFVLLLAVTPYTEQRQDINRYKTVHSVKKYVIFMNIDSVFSK